MLRAHALGLGRFRGVERAVRFLCDFGQPKVENLRRSALGHKDVGRLDVAVNDALGVRRVQRVRDINSNRQ